MDAVQFKEEFCSFSWVCVITGYILSILITLEHLEAVGFDNIGKKPSLSSNLYSGFLSICRIIQGWFLFEMSISL